MKAGFSQRLDQVTTLIPTNDGQLFNIETGELRVRTTSDYYTYTINGKYDPDVDTTLIRTFFWQLMCQSEELYWYLLYTLGIYISSKFDDKSFLICYGASGNNGKTTMINLLKKLLGPQLHAANEGVFQTTKRGTANSHTSHLNALKSKRLSILNEPSMRKLNISQIKALTGSDDIAIRNLGKEEETIRMTSHLIMVTNNLPEIDCADKAFSNRVKVLNFNAAFECNPDSSKFNEYQADPDILNKLSTPENLDALFTILCQCATLYFKDHSVYVQPEQVKVSVTEFIEERFIYADFLQHCCIADLNAKTQASELYRVYHIYTRSMNGDPDKSNNFYKAFKGKYRDNQSKSSNSYYKGIRIKDEYLNISSQTTTHYLQR